MVSQSLKKVKRKYEKDSEILFGNGCIKVVG